eukprot:Clim_evm32s3 gene=Clim_evmTU32s3
MAQVVSIPRRCLVLKRTDNTDETRMVTFTLERYLADFDTFDVTLPYDPDEAFNDQTTLTAADIAASLQLEQDGLPRYSCFIFTSLNYCSDSVKDSNGAAVCRHALYTDTDPMTNQTNYVPNEIYQTLNDYIIMYQEVRRVYFQAYPGFENSCDFFSDEDNKSGTQADDLMVLINSPVDNIKPGADYDMEFVFHYRAKCPENYEVITEFYDRETNELLGEGAAIQGLEFSLFFTTAKWSADQNDFAVVWASWALDGQLPTPFPVFPVSFVMLLVVLGWIVLMFTIVMRYANERSSEKKIQDMVKNRSAANRGKLGYANGYSNSDDNSVSALNPDNSPRDEDGSPRSAEFDRSPNQHFGELELDMIVGNNRDEALNMFVKNPAEVEDITTMAPADARADTDILNMWGGSTSEEFGESDANNYWESVGGAVRTKDVRYEEDLDTWR